MSNFDALVALTLSKLLSPEQRTTLLDWLPNSAKQLLFRASRDGFSASDFHSRCDGRGGTVVLVQTTDNDTIFGGYTPLSWTSGCDTPKVLSLQTLSVGIFWLKSSKKLLSKNFCVVQRNTKWRYLHETWWLLFAGRVTFREEITLENEVVDEN